jgi:FAD/FMN-containing dehydrogenase
VTPGTKHVSLGGAVAADVHGKNHHRDGSLGHHVEELELLLADGSRVHCGPRHGRELFWATVGGMGLTGIITRVTLRLIPVTTPWLVAQHAKAPTSRPPSTGCPMPSTTISTRSPGSTA